MFTKKLKYINKNGLCFFIVVKKQENKTLKFEIMKTFRNIFAVVIVLFVFNSAIASGLRVNMVANDAELTVVEIANNKMSNFEIEVTNVYGDDLYRIETKVPVNEFKKRYDFSALEDGTYFYSVKIDKEKVVKELEVEDGLVKVADIRKTIDPYFVKQDDLLKMSFLNFQKEDVKIYIYGPNNDLVSEFGLGNDFAINKALNVEDLEMGDYELVLTHNNDYYEYQFSVN